jgi:2-polyprenyl-3-methyl-5-hydroxy-6-metoxy-1,4-benzoquinol methylase
VTPPSLAVRRREPEAMDAPDLPAGLHDAALDGLARINRWSRAAPALWSAVAELLGAELAHRAPRPPTLLDVACGGGDVPVALALRARAAGAGLAITACDRSPTALAHARRRAAARGVDVAFTRADVLRDPLPGPADLVTCSLFMHHLDEPDAVALLGTMRTAARRALLVCDLRRSRAGLLLAQVGTRLLSRSPIVHADGPASVRAAFTPAELSALALRAGLAGARVRNLFPQRMMLVWTRPGT